MYIERKEYLDKLLSHRWNGQIKVITGIRRCGKSFLVFTIFRDYLLSEGVKSKNIIAIALDDLENRELTDPEKLYGFIKSRIASKTEEYYVLIDEVQYAISEKELKDKDNPPVLYSVLNGILRLGNVDIYVTGSNSKLLVKDVMTEFRGRGDEIKIFPLSFKEFLSASDKDKDAAFTDYMLYGGLPQVLLYDSFEDKAQYLSGLFRSTYLKDIIERNKVEREDVLDELTDVLCSATGSLTNLSNLANAINSRKHAKAENIVSENTVKAYTEYMQEAFLFSRARRYDIRGKAYFESQSKYYAIDTGLRNARLGFRQIEETHLMENVIYNYLIQQGFLVDVGMVEKYQKDKDGKRRREQYEIDFVVNRGMYRYYIQSAFTLDSKEKEQRELYPFSIVGNSFKKLVVTRSELIPHYDENGIIHVGIVDLLLGDYLADRL